MGAVIGSFGAGAIVRCNGNDGVIQISTCLQRIQNPAKLFIGMAQRGGKHLHLAGIQTLLI